MNAKQIAEMGEQMGVDTHHAAALAAANAEIERKDRRIAELESSYRVDISLRDCTVESKNRQIESAERALESRNSELAALCAELDMFMTQHAAMCDHLSPMAQEAVENGDPDALCGHLCTEWAAKCITRLRAELATARAERDEYKDACEDLMGKHRNADKDCHNCKHRACYSLVFPCVKCLEEYRDGQPVSLWEERDGECFTAHEAEVHALRADAARNADAAEALAGLERLNNAHWHLSYDPEGEQWAAIRWGHNRIVRLLEAKTALAAVQAAEGGEDKE